MRYVRLIPYEKMGKQRLRYDKPTLLRHKLLHKKGVVHYRAPDRDLYDTYKNQLNNMQFALKRNGDTK